MELAHLFPIKPTSFVIIDPIFQPCDNSPSNKIGNEQRATGRPILAMTAFIMDELAELVYVPGGGGEAK
jgi:hypothetical protein